MFNKKRNSFIVIILIAFILTLSSCASQQTETSTTLAETTEQITQSAYPREITNPQGATITIEKEPQKIISLNSDITEIIYALGDFEKIAGRSDFDTYPPEIENVTSVGSSFTLNFEKITELDADIILCSEMIMDDNVKKLEELGQKLIRIQDGTTIESVYEKILFISKILNKEDIANETIAQMKTELSEMEQQTKDMYNPTVYYVVDFGEYGDYTAGGNTFIGELIKIAGGINIAEEVTDWKYSVEKVVENNPDIIICDSNYGAEELLKQANGYKDLPAIQNGSIYSVDSNLLNIAGPRLVEGAKLLNNIFYNYEQTE